MHNPGYCAMHTMYCEITSCNLWVTHWLTINAEKPTLKPRNNSSILNYSVSCRVFALGYSLFLFFIQFHYMGADWVFLLRPSEIPRFSDRISKHLFVAFCSLSGLERANISICRLCGHCSTQVSYLSPLHLAAVCFRYGGHNFYAKDLSDKYQIYMPLITHSDMNPKKY